jgi:hypothetical protein
MITYAWALAFTKAVTVIMDLASYGDRPKRNISLLVIAFSLCLVGVTKVDH